MQNILVALSKINSTIRERHVKMIKKRDTIQSQIKTYANRFQTLKMNQETVYTASLGI